jgi:hypothetical protein
MERFANVVVGERGRHCRIGPFAKRCELIVSNENIHDIATA